jgi:WD40 repeat protein
MGGNMRFRYAVIVGVLLVGVVALAAVAFGRGGGPTTKLVSRNSNGDPAANGGSFADGITPNGRWVAFNSYADNLPGTAGGTINQVYVRDRKTGKTILVSRSNNGNAPGNDGSYDSGISNNGRFVAFESTATNLPGSLGPTYYQVYIRDLKNKTTKLVSRLSGGDPASGGDSTDVSISGSGQLVAFESDATNLPGTLSPDDQVYLRNTKSQKTSLVSKTSGGSPANDDSEDPAITPNGNIVAFESEGSNLPGAIGNNDDEAYVRDLRGGRTILVSRNSAGDPANDDTEDTSVSSNGRFVEFESYATNLPGSLGPTYTQVYLRDRKQDKTQLISRKSNGDAATGGYSDNGSTSADGRFVLFESEATNLPGTNAGNFYQVFLRDRQNDNTKLVSKSNSGDPADSDSYVNGRNNLLSKDPRFAAFYSYSSNLPGALGPTYAQAYIRGPKP